MKTAMQEYAAKIAADIDMEGADEPIEAAMVDAGIITAGEIISEIDMRDNVMYVVMPERGTTIVIQADGTHTEE